MGIVKMQVFYIKRDYFCTCQHTFYLICKVDLAPEDGTNFASQYGDLQVQREPFV